MTKVIKSDDEWQKILSRDDFEITRRAGTEPAFTGIYNNEKTPGVYQCKCLRCAAV